MSFITRTRSARRLAVGLPILAVAAFAAGTAAFAATSSQGSTSTTTCTHAQAPASAAGHAEAMLANLSPSAGSTVNPGDTISLLHTDETPIGLSTSTITSPTITIDSTTVTATVATTSGVTPTYLQPSDGGSMGTDCQSTITFTIPTGLPGGTHTVTIKGYDSDNDHETVSFTYSTPVSTPTPTPTPKPTPNFVTSQSLTPNDEAFLGQDATGTVTFELFKPSLPNCGGTPSFKQVVTVTSADNGVALTTNTTFIASTPGTWKWIVIYSGDSTHPASTATCGFEKFTITNHS